MGFFDRFRPKREQLKKEKKVRHVVDQQSAKEAAFAAVGSAPKTPTNGADRAEAKPEGKSGKAGSGSAGKTGPMQRDDTKLAYRVLVRALVTEKTTALKAQNRYAFAVNPNANKLSVRDAVLALYGVRPVNVTIQNFSGKHVRYGRALGRTKDWKRAIVTLPHGKTIDVTEA
jgi:large subunit ribosomal protein L23